jgi:hypothetical protein
MTIDLPPLLCFTGGSDHGLNKMIKTLVKSWKDAVLEHDAVIA